MTTIYHRFNTMSPARHSYDTYPSVHMRPSKRARQRRANRPVSIFRRTRKRFHASKSRQVLKRAAYRLTLGCRWIQLCANAHVNPPQTYMASKTSIDLPNENPMIHFLSTEKEYDEFTEARKRIPAQSNPLLRVSTPPIITPKPKARSLDDLPPEILIEIWKYVAATPSWFHVKYGSQHVHSVTTDTHWEHWVNRKWYFAPEFRRSLTRHPIQESMYSYARTLLQTYYLNHHDVSGPLVQAVTDNAWSIVEWSRLYTDQAPFKVYLEGVERYPIVRPAVDWFYLENYASAFSATPSQIYGMPHLYRVSTIVLKLEDIYTDICRALNLTDGGVSLERWLVDRSSVERYIRKMSMVFGTLVEFNSKLEKCIILVGDLRRGVQPSDLQEISVGWASLDEESSTDTQREIITAPKVSSDDRAMIRFIHQGLEHFARHQREWSNSLLRSVEGEAWLADIRHSASSTRSRWLASTEGSIWRETTDEGKAWLQTASGHWWLASVPGSPWLETQKGLEWLDSEAGTLFLEEPIARVWAGVNNSGRAAMRWYGVEETRGKLPRKKWFSTEKGRAWIAEHCRDYRVPVAPEPPLPKDGGDWGLEMPALFFTRPLPRWAFMMVPTQAKTWYDRRN
ncbi:hypothetical protein F5Y01DRAFT_84386 [Xylaria sp. FL0043]|nr:hypothetical protein F5Y01DRAFT_84386 [Xylaria sp. FL0043]